MAPNISMEFLMAVLAVAEAIDFISVVSFVRCEISSAVLFLSKKFAESVVMCLNVSFRISWIIFSPIHMTK